MSPAASVTVAHTIATLARWQRTFTVPSYWVTDHGTNFINEVLPATAETHNTLHKPTVAYSPWTNGPVELLNSDIPSTLRSIFGELKLGTQD